MARRRALGDPRKRRVLWVSNRVADCQATFERLPRRRITPSPRTTSAFCYHSRFKLEDRKARHKALIGAFQDAVKDGASKPRAVLGATTQVCEMSLDLDAEILLTDLSPIASLIQRMGRCNRDSKKMRDRPPGRVYVLRPEPGKEKPYDEGGTGCRSARFVNDLARPRSTVSQDNLEAILRKLCDPGERRTGEALPVPRQRPLRRRPRKTRSGRLTSSPSRHPRR